MNLARFETAQLACPFENLLEVVHREIKMIGNRRTGVFDEGEDHLAAIKIVTPAAYLAARIIKQLRVKLDARGKVRDRDKDSEQSRCIFHWQLSFWFRHNTI